MFSTMPSNSDPRSTAARMARRTASRDSGVGIVTVSTGGGLPRISHSRFDRVAGSGEWGVVHSQQPRNCGTIQVGIEHPDGLARAGEGARNIRRDIALAHAAFPAHHRHDPPHPGQALRHALALGADLVRQPRAVRIGQLVVGAHGLKTSRGGGWSVSIWYD